MTPTLKCQEHTYSEKTGPGRCGKPALYEVTFLHAQISGRAKAFMCGKHSAEMVHGSWSIRRSRLPVGGPLRANKPITREGNGPLPSTENKSSFMTGPK